MTFIRNEILESGQEVILYMKTTWSGAIRGSGILVKKINTSIIGSEYWNVSSDCFLGIDDNWWFGEVGCFDKSNVKTKE